MYSELFCIPLKQRVVRWITDWISSRYIIVWSERSLWLRLLIAYLITLDAYIAVKVFFSSSSSFEEDSSQRYFATNC